jgi:GH24 family phage-related lysozyme (muramidase)
MNEALTLSAAGEALIKGFEQCAQRAADGSYHAYHCPAGVLTIGWGHTNA